jgi:hypothetical protein
MRSPYYKKFEKKKPEDPRNFGESASSDDKDKFIQSIMSSFRQ